MGYRGEDVPSAHGDRGRQQPWQPSPGTAPGSAGAARDGRSRAYSGDDGGYGYGPDGGFPGQGQQGQAPQGGQYGDPYAQAPYGEGQADYGDGPQGYSRDGYGYDQTAGYGQPPGYDDRSAPGYGSGGGYQEPNPGYGRPGGYPTPPGDGYASPPGGGSGAYPTIQGNGGSGAYPTRSGAYPTRQGGGSGAYPTIQGNGGSGAYPTRSGAYPTRQGNGASGAYPTIQGSGAYPTQPGGTGGYPAADAGNDWYGGQPAAAKGASFADTGTYALNGRVIDEYGTGPQGTMRDPVRGYPPGPGQRGSGPMPSSPAPRLALPAPPATPPSVAETRQQARLDEPPTRPGRAPTGSFRGAVSGEFQQAPGGGPGGTPTGGFSRSPTGGFSRSPTGGFSGSPPGSARGPATGGFPGSADRDTFGSPGGRDDYQEEFHELGEADDAYQDHVDGPARPRASGGGGRGSGKAGHGGSPRGGKRLLYAALGVVAVGIIGAAAYVFVLQPSSPSGNAVAAGPLPTGSAQPSMQACQQALGTYCHISTAADDPKPLTAAELYPPAVTDEKDKSSYSLVSTKVDTKCASAVIGANLIKALQTGKCTQVVRGSYVSSDNKIMGTIGVVNLDSTNEAHYAGRDVGQNDFIAPLTSAKGVASKLGNGEGVVEAEFKGHYLILTWSEYVNGTAPTTKAQDAQLEQFSSDLVNDTANVALTQRMVTGAPATAGATS